MVGSQSHIGLTEVSEFFCLLHQDPTHPHWGWKLHLILQSTNRTLKISQLGIVLQNTLLETLMYKSNTSVVIIHFIATILMQ